MTLVNKADLGNLDHLATGAQAVIYRLPDYSLPGFGMLLLKEYKSSPGSEISVQALQLVLQQRSGLESHKRAWLDKSTAWPLRIVIERQRVVGIVMAMADASFLQELRLFTKLKTKVRESQHLFGTPDDRAAVGIAEPTSQHRVELCRALAHLLSRLHSMDIIYGDVSSLNVIYRLVPEPGVFLIDCDAVRINSNGPVVPQLHSPDWDPPECLGGPYRNIQSKTTDRYKLGLFILRCLSPGIDSSQLRDPESAVGALDETGMDLLRRSLSTVPGNRPTATTWYKHFRDPTSTAGRAAGRAAVSVPGATRSTPGYRLENGKWVRR